MEREQSVETSLAELEDRCVANKRERKCLTQGHRFTEPFSDSHSLYDRNPAFSFSCCPHLSIQLYFLPIGLR
jgi:hypothetical protein